MRKPSRAIRFLGAGLIGAAGLLAAAPSPGADGDPRSAVLLDIKGGIGPATSDYVGRGIAAAEAAHAELVILRMDTPGGLDAATRDINHAILASKVPVVGYVAPEGARAASAGTYILYACHLAAMAPATSVGAATPVGIGGGDIGGTPDKPEMRKDESKPEPSDEDAKESPAKPKDGASKHAESNDADGASPPGTALGRKTVNDAIAYIKSLAELRGRNVEFAEAAVRSAATLTARAALEQHVIDLVASDLDELLERIDGRELEIAGTALTLRTKGAAVRTIEPDWRNRLLSVLTDPTIAYLLLLIGLYGLVLEGYHPGAILPGTVGAIALLLALYALHVLPVNYAGLALILLGVGLIVTETLVPGYGALGIGGVAALTLGSIMLLDVDVPGYEVSRGLIFGIAASSGAGLALVLRMATRARSRPVTTGASELIGHEAVACQDFERTGPVRIRGEVWTARSAVPVRNGQAVRVQSIDGLVLEIAPEP